MTTLPAAFKPSMFSALAIGLLPLISLEAAAQSAVPAAAAAAAAAANVAASTNAINSGNTAWLLVCTVLVLLMTVPGIMLFYSGMMRSKNALSVVAHVFAATAMVTLTWVVMGYSLAFTPGNGWIGDLSRLFGEGLVGNKVKVHPLAPTVPESAFFMFQLAFAIIAFALIVGATVERMRLSATIFFATLWTLLVYAPVAHWVWQPTGWLAALGHMDYAGGTVVHIAAGASGLVAAKFVGPRKGFGQQPMVPSNLMVTVIGAGLLWAGWFGFNAGSAFEASARAVGAVLATQVAACTGAFVWGMAEYVQRGRFSVLGMATGAIAGLVAVTPASGFVGVGGAAAIGTAAVVCCFVAVNQIKKRTGIDDTLDVFALHGVGGFVGTALTPVFALGQIAPVTSTVLTNIAGGAAVMVYAGAMTFVILLIVKPLAGLRVSAAEEAMGLDLAQHGEMASSG